MSNSEICKNVRDELALAGRVPEDESIREHLATCEECARFAKTLEALERDLGRLGNEDVSDETVARLLARPELRTLPSVRWRRWGAGLGVAAALALMLVTQRMLSFRDRAPRLRDGVAGIAESPSGAQAEIRVRQDARDEPAQEKAKDGDDKEQLAPESQIPLGESVARAGVEGGVPGGIVGGEKKNDSGAAAAAGESDELLEANRMTVTVDKLAKTEEETKRQLQSPDVSSFTDSRTTQEGGRGSLAPGKIPARRSQIEPVYPDKAMSAHVQGTVVLEVSVDRDGNVIDSRILRSIPLLDQAALDAVRQWKYETSASDELRRFEVSVEFRLPEAPKPKDLTSARALLEDRARLDGLAFREARGYWANTYVPGDATLRRLAARLESEAADLPHRDARPAALPLDPSETSAISLTLHADRVGITEKSRLLVQVGIRAADRASRRRPPMNVAVVLDLPAGSSADDARASRALLEGLESAREPGDRFRLIATGPGGGELLSPEAFRRGALLVALQDLDERSANSPQTSFLDALSLAYEKVLAEDDPAKPLGTSLVLVVSGRPLGAALEESVRLASHGAIGGVTLSAVGLATDGPESESETKRLALAGQGRAYALTEPREGEAASIVDRELSAGSRTVARALRLRIQLAEGVQLVDVLGSAPLSERETERTRSEEKAIDARLSKNLGIEADRGKDEDGIQIVIPAFYAGDMHSILLDVVASGPGPIAEVTARYKDLIQLQNTVARASLALTRSEAAAGPLETSVLKDYLDYRVSETLSDASAALRRRSAERARVDLEETRSLLSGLTVLVPTLSEDRDVSRDMALLDRYEELVAERTSPNAIHDLYDSLLYASSLKRLWHPLS
jgi:TonB family protein